MILLEDLEIYKLANEIGEEVWNLINEWNFFAKDTLGKQLTRAADSISLNIAEGYGRFHFKENKNFCYYSRGSAYETKNGLLKALKRNLISHEQHKQIFDKLELFSKKLNSYIKSIGKMEIQQININKDTINDQ